jgi:hypothetical protein
MPRPETARLMGAIRWLGYPRYRTGASTHQQPIADTALTIATIPARIASGSRSHASMTAARSGSSGRTRVAVVVLALMPVVRYKRNAWLEARARARLGEHWERAPSIPLRPNNTNTIDAVIAPKRPEVPELGDLPASNAAGSPLVVQPAHDIMDVQLAPVPAASA